MARHSLFLEPGDTEIRIFQYKNNNSSPINTTGYTASFVTLGFGAANLALSIGTGIVMDGPAGSFTVTVSPTQTDAMKAVANIGYYKLRLTSPALVKTTVVEGALVITGD